MAQRVSKAIFKTNACELFRQLETLGGTVIVTDHGRSAIKILSYTNKKDSDRCSSRRHRLFLS